MHASTFAISAGMLVASNVFMTFACYAHVKQPLKLGYLWASLRILGAVYFVFRG